MITIDRDFHRFTTGYFHMGNEFQKINSQEIMPHEVIITCHPLSACRRDRMRYNRIDQFSQFVTIFASV